MKILIAVTLALTLATASNFNVSESEIAPRGRILNGQDADPTQIPYMVGLITKHSDSKLIWCGGTLIKKNWILTAAHCLKDIIQVDVLLGAWNRKIPDKRLTVMAKDTIVNENYNAVTKVHDIGLIKIPSVDFTDRIHPIKLPKKGKSDYCGKKVLVAGWGTTTYNTGPVDTLQWGHMEVIRCEGCAKINNKLAPCFAINAKAIDDVSVCFGDSGGPLVLESNPNVLIGVSILGTKPGCDDRIRFVFANVQAYLDWIKKMTK